MQLTHKELTRLKAHYRFVQEQRERREALPLWTRVKEFVVELVRA